AGAVLLLALAGIEQVLVEDDAQGDLRAGARGQLGPGGLAATRFGPLPDFVGRSENAGHRTLQKEWPGDRAIPIAGTGGSVQGLALDEVVVGVIALRTAQSELLAVEFGKPGGPRDRARALVDARHAFRHSRALEAQREAGAEFAEAGRPADERG